MNGGPTWECSGKLRNLVKKLEEINKSDIDGDGTIG